MAPKFCKYENKKVEVVGTNDQVYIGTVNVYMPANDNDGEEALALDCGVWLDSSDIKSIKIID